MSLTLARSDTRIIGPAASGAEAVRLAEREPPDIAVIDIGLVGGMDGWAVARQLRERFGTRTVLVTGGSLDDVDARAHAIGAAACLYKPFRATELVDAVTQARRM